MSPREQWRSAAAAIPSRHPALTQWSVLRSQPLSSYQAGYRRRPVPRAASHRDPFSAGHGAVQRFLTAAFECSVWPTLASGRSSCWRAGPAAGPAVWRVLPRQPRPRPPLRIQRTGSYGMPPASLRSLQCSASASASRSPCPPVLGGAADGAPGQLASLQGFWPAVGMDADHPSGMEQGP